MLPFTPRPRIKPTIWVGLGESVRCQRAQSVVARHSHTGVSKALHTSRIKRVDQPLRTSRLNMCGYSPSRLARTAVRLQGLATSEQPLQLGPVLPPSP
eukprot:214460-Chlamydomonas_euryale.AAC.2